MLVKALKLRRMGERISPEELRATPPMVGNLSVKQDQLRRLATRGSRTALLMPLGGGCEPLAQLHSARLALIDHRGLVIQGIEESWRRKQCTDHRQALWCWPVDPSEALPKDARDAIDIEEEALALGDALRLGVSILTLGRSTRFVGRGVGLINRAQSRALRDGQGSHTWQEAASTTKSTLSACSASFGMRSWSASADACARSSVRTLNLRSHPCSARKRLAQTSRNGNA